MDYCNALLHGALTSTIDDGREGSGKGGRKGERRREGGEKRAYKQSIIRCAASAEKMDV